MSRDRAELCRETRHCRGHHSWNSGIRRGSESFGSPFRLLANQLRKHIVLLLCGPCGPGPLLALLVFLGAAASTLLVLYGGVYVLVGGLVLGGVITPSEPVDRHGLRWHVFVWDLWFLLWGLALGLATWRSHVDRSSSA